PCPPLLPYPTLFRSDLKEATVSASCATITVELAHTGKLPVTAMGHNVVVAKTPDMAGIARDGIKAGAAGGYVAKDDARVIAHTRSEEYTSELQSRVN